MICYEYFNEDDLPTEDGPFRDCIQVVCMSEHITAHREVCLALHVCLTASCPVSSSRVPQEQAHRSVQPYLTSQQLCPHAGACGFVSTAAASMSHPLMW